jgi:uncharacterized protein (DUF1800 family)
MCFSWVIGFAQEEGYYLGAGNTDGLTISSSVSAFETNSLNLVNGNGMDAKRMEVARFLAQATLGFEDYHVEEVAQLGFEGWIDTQMAVELSLYLPEFQHIYAECEREYNEFKEEGDSDYFPGDYHFNYAWWHTNLTNEDLLRQRVAFALSEIFVISMESDLELYPEGVSAYYDMLGKHAFGNYRDLLYDVSLHPCMGFFLSHFRNPKTDLENNIFPDENYAREIMQLFSIGLYELNSDGSRKTDANSNYIPAYDNSDIREMARVFTGLCIGGFDQRFLDYLEGLEEPVPELSFDYEFVGTQVDKTIPMKMYEDFHEQGEKIILKDNIIPDGQSGIKDINDAVDILFNHENVGPFIGRKLIQHLVKSNPTPAYIERISAVFADNGSGERGDLGAVIKAILLDEEARNCSYLQDPDHGKLREPVIRFSQLFRLIPKTAPFGYYWSDGSEVREELKNHPMRAPSVFNFFLPDFQPVGDLAKNNLVGPEFQIHNSQTSVSYINQMKLRTIYQYFFKGEGDSKGWGDDVLLVTPNYPNLASNFTDTEALINYFDAMLTNGRLSDRTRNIIRSAINDLEGGGMLDHLTIALYLIMISPDYIIMK